MLQPCISQHKVITSILDQPDADGCTTCTVVSIQSSINCPPFEHNKTQTYLSQQQQQQQQNQPEVNTQQSNSVRVLQTTHNRMMVNSGKTRATANTVIINCGHCFGTAPRIERDTKYTHTKKRKKKKQKRKRRNTPKKRDTGRERKRSTKCLTFLSFA